MQEQRIKQDFWIKGKLILIEDVPAGVCPQCGEKIVRAEVGRDIATLIESSKQWPTERIIKVPVISFIKEVARRSEPRTLNFFSEERSLSM